ncbi:uncharacterized protein [Arachis hypogaea]|uniref:uncharacterized protein isoform X1 n=1 Tax=Arachis hypogaea TaxID=3818 RepID=UPI0034E67D61
MASKGLSSHFRCTREVYTNVFIHRGSKGQVSPKVQRNHHRRNTESTLETKQKETFAGIETARTPSVCWSDTKILVTLLYMESVNPSAVTPSKKLARNFAKVLHLRALIGITPVDGLKNVISDANLKNDGNIGKGTINWSHRSTKMVSFVWWEIKTEVTTESFEPSLLFSHYILVPSDEISLLF